MKKSVLNNKRKGKLREKMMKMQVDKLREILRQEEVTNKTDDD